MPCPHEDWPCCGCGPELLTPEEAEEREDEYWDINSDHPTVLDVDCLDDIDLHDLAFEDRLCGEAY